MPIYAVTIAKGGHKMKERKEGDGGEPHRMLFNGPNVPGRDVNVAMLAEGRSGGRDRRRARRQAV